MNYYELYVLFLTNFYTSTLIYAYDDENNSEAPKNFVPILRYSIYCKNTQLYLVQLFSKELVRLQVLQNVGVVFKYISYKNVYFTFQNYVPS